MPQRAFRPCSAPGCPELVRDGRYCKQHATKINKRYNKQRGTSAQRGYGANWRKLRKMVLARNPICEDPFGLHKEYSELIKANEVDHIIPKKHGGESEMSNLQSLCKSCHSKKTAVEDGRWALERVT